MLLGVLEHIYILGDSLNLEVIALHFVMQRQKVEGVPACAFCLYVREEVLQCDVGVYCLYVLELADPCISDDGED